MWILAQLERVAIEILAILPPNEKLDVGNQCPFQCHEFCF
jgi:hypothetical protein